MHLAAGQVDERAVVTDASGPADLDAVHRHVEGGRVEGGPGRADGREHPPPVGVVAEDGALEEVVARHRPRDLERVVDADRRAHLDGDVVGGALGVSDELPREVGTHRRQGGRQLVAAHRDPRRPGGEHDDRVVGRHARVGVDPVEGDGRRRAQGRVEVGGIDDGVGGEHDEHRRECRREHARRPWPCRDADHPSPT